MSEASRDHDLSAESALLSAALHYPAACLPDLRARLKPSDFFSRQHALLFEAVLALDSDGAPVEPSEVFARLEHKAGHGLSEEDLSRLREVYGAKPEAMPSVLALLEKVLARSRSRELARRLEQLLAEARKAPEDLRRHLETALAALLPLAQEPGTGEEDSLASVASRLKRRSSRRPSGWPLLDAQEPWFAEGELCLVLGRTGHGKTNFLLNLAEQWMAMDPEAAFAFYSLEMTEEQLAARLMAQRAARSEGKTPEGWGTRLHLKFQARLDVERLAADALRRLAGRRAGAVFVDSLTALMPPPQGRFHGRRDLELAEVCRRLKELAVALRCPVVATVPARRDNLRESGTPLRDLLAKGAEFNQPEVEDAIRSRRPRLEHLPEPGLEAHADVVVALLGLVADYQEELDPEHRQVFKTRASGPLEVAALKNRGGPLHGVELEMEMKSGWIREPSA